MRTDCGRWRTACATTALAVSPGCSLAASSHTSSLWWVERNAHINRRSRIILTYQQTRLTSVVQMNKWHRAIAEALNRYNTPVSIIHYLNTHLCAFHDEVSGHLQFPGHLLQPGRGNPCRWMMRIGLPHWFKQQTGLLDVTGRTKSKMCQARLNRRPINTPVWPLCLYLMSPPCVGIMELRSVR